MPLHTASIPYRIYELPDGRYCGVATVTTPAGPVTVRAVASPTEEAQKLIAQLREGGATSGFLGKVFKAVAKSVTSPVKAAVNIAKNVAKGKIKKALGVAVKQVTSSPIAKRALPIVTKNPAVQAALGAASSTFLGPLGPMVVPAALRMAGGLIDQARGGNKAAASKIAQIQSQARRGNPRAKAMALQIKRAAALKRRSPSFFRQAQTQAEKLAALKARRGLHLWKRWAAAQKARGRAAGGVSGYGEWVDTAAGQVFVPAAYAGDFMANIVHELRPRAGYRSEGDALTLREAYRSGLRSSPR